MSLNLTGSNKYNKVPSSVKKKFYKKEEEKLKEQEQQLQSAYTSQGAVLNKNTQYSGPAQKINATTSGYLGATMTPDYTQKATTTNKVVETAKEAEANTKKVQEISSQDTTQQLKQQVQEQYNKTAQEYQNYLTSKVSEKEVNIADKILGPVTYGAGSTFSALSSKYYLQNENGEYYKPSSYSELMQEKIQESYNTKLGKLYGNATGELGRIGITSALNMIAPYAGTATYFTDIYLDTYNNALEQNYDDKKAASYALVSTATEFITEKLIGGLSKGIFGKESSSDLSKNIATKLSEKLLKEHPKVATTIANGLSEGAEEFVQEFLDVYTRNATLGEDNKITLDTLENALYSGLVGALTGAGATVFTNVTQNDVRDYQKLNKDIVSKIEENVGSNLSESDKSDIEQIVNDITNENPNIKDEDVVDEVTKFITDYNERQKGYSVNIDTSKITNKNALNTIENAQKANINNTYKYRTFVSNMANVSEKLGIDVDFTTNEKLKLEDRLKLQEILTEEQQEKINELEEQIKNTDNAEDIARWQQQIDDIKYFDTGGFVKTENGKETLVLNMDSRQNLDRVIGHELKHILEKANSNTSFNDFLFAYAKEQGDYDTFREEIERVYKDIEGVDVDSELSANLVAKYLFTDNKFISELASKPSFAQKVKQALTNMVNYVKGTPQEKRYIELKNKFMKLYKEAQKAQVKEESNVKYSIEDRVSGDKLLDTLDLIEEIENVGAKVDDNGYVTLYHQTTNENAKKIIETGKMIAHEPYVYFSTSQNATQSDGRGTTKLEFKIPAEKLLLDDLFDDNADVKILLDKSKELNVKNYLVNNAKYSISEKDSQGRELSEGQREYFKDSKVIDEEGNLQTLYTGRKHDYTTFDKTKMSAESKWGKGIYLTKYKEVSELYGDYIKEVYVNIENPISDRLKTITFDEYNNLFKAIYDGEEAYQEEYDMYKNDLDLLWDITNKGNWADYSEQIKEYTGKDGIIISRMDPDADMVIAFNSNQIKNVDNLNPTESEDIRYRLSETTEENTAREFFDRDLQDVLYQTQPATQEQIESELNAPVDYSNVEYYEPEIEYEEEKVTPTQDLFETRDYYDVGNRKVNAYQYDNPEVKPYFKQASFSMYDDLNNAIKGEKFAIGNTLTDLNVEYGGTKRQVADDIIELLDGVDGKYKMTYDDIKKGLDDIINDNGSENNAKSKRIEFYLDQRLRNGYEKYDGTYIEPNQEYLDTIRASEIYKSGEIPQEREVTGTFAAEEPEDVLVITQMEESPKILNTNAKDVVKTSINELKGEPLPQVEESKVATILNEEPTRQNASRKVSAIVRTNIFDKGALFEDLALKTKNRNLYAKWNYTLYSGARSQNIVGNGHYQYVDGERIQTSKSLDNIQDKVSTSGLTNEFSDYMYHQLNIDRMTLNERYGTDNKPVFSEETTADISRQKVTEYETQYPQFTEWANDLYEYVNADKQLLVDYGVISQETSDMWKEMYPHYIPIRRDITKGNAVEVPIYRAGIQTPVKSAKGGSSDILPMFNTIAMRTNQTQNAIARNSFGLELYNSLNTNSSTNETNVDEIIDDIDNQENLLNKTDKGATFTVFDNGNKITYDVTLDMYDALKPTADWIRTIDNSKLAKGLQKVSNFRRALITDKNPTFLITNAVKDIQDVFVNSQHAAKTYAEIPEAYAQIISNGYWYKEYLANGGEQNTYFENTQKQFIKDTDSNLMKTLKWLPDKISYLNGLIEQAPRVAEYIASRKMGRNVEISMLDSANVTTNFKAGGDVAKMLNRNGATFLNASIQGARQQVRNVREAKANGVMGIVKLTGKFVIGGVAISALMDLIWDDDEDYQELSDYVKQNYYLIGKNQDGTFIRIPKGRVLAVFQDAFKQMENLATGNDEADFKSFYELVINNLAPNNPLSENVFAPLVQAFGSEEGMAWYGGDLVPTRLQNLPASEQYDETTDAFSKWLGDKLNVSPYKINYVLDQYSGAIGDVLLPMTTTGTETGAETFMDYVTAPLVDKFTTNAVQNNQNVSDIYDLSEELTTNANKTNATDEDELKNKFINSIKSEMNELYKQKREIQNSDLSNSEKFSQVLDIQKEINELAEYGNNNYENLEIDGQYAKIGNREYRLTTSEDGDETWSKINDTQATKSNQITTVSGLTKGQYWNYYTEINSLKSDKDSNGNTINGSLKSKVIKYVNSLNISTLQKAYLIKMKYSSYTAYDNQIIQSIKNSDLTATEKQELYKTLGYK